MTGFNQIEMRVLVYRNHLNSDSMQHKIPSLIPQHQHAFNTPVLLALIKQKVLIARTWSLLWEGGNFAFSVN